MTEVGPVGPPGVGCDAVLNQIGNAVEKMRRFLVAGWNRGFGRIIPINWKC